MVIIWGTNIRDQHRIPFKSSFIPDGPSFGQSALSLVRTADLVWTDVRLGASHGFRALSKAVSGAKAKSMSLHNLS